VAENHRFLRLVTAWTLFWIAILCAPSTMVRIGFTGEARETEVSTTGEDQEYDPWEPFNERMFEFNRGLDRVVLKPVAKGYDYLLPDLVQKGVRLIVKEERTVGGQLGRPHDVPCPQRISHIVQLVGVRY